MNKTPTTLSPEAYELFKSRVHRHKHRLATYFIDRIEAEGGPQGVMDFISRNPHEKLDRLDFLMTNREQEILMSLPGFFGRRKLLTGAVAVALGGVAATAGGFGYSAIRGVNNMSPDEKAVVQDVKVGGVAAAGFGSGVSFKLYLLGNSTQWECDPKIGEHVIAKADLTEKYLDRLNAALHQTLRELAKGNETSRGAGF